LEKCKKLIHIRIALSYIASAIERKRSQSSYHVFHGKFKPIIVPKEKKKLKPIHLRVIQTTRNRIYIISVRLQCYPSLIFFFLEKTWFLYNDSRIYYISFNFLYFIFTNSSYITCRTCMGMSSIIGFCICYLLVNIEMQGRNFSRLQWNDDQILSSLQWNDDQIQLCYVYNQMIEFWTIIDCV
jgi:hypothetical protein